MIRFIVDAQLPPAFAAKLSEAGFESQHVQDLKLETATDSEIWMRALSGRAVIVSKDQDFAERAIHSRRKTPVIWMRLGNVTSAALWRAFEPLLPEIIEALEAGETLIEVT